MLGWQELVIILIIVLVIFGAGKLPTIGEALGKSIKNFKKSMKGEEEIDVTHSAKRIESPNQEEQNISEEVKQKSKTPLSK